MAYPLSISWRTSGDHALIYMAVPIFHSFFSIDWRGLLPEKGSCAFTMIFNYGCLEVKPTHGYPPVVIVQTGPYKSFWFRHFQNLRCLPNFPRIYNTFTIEGNLGSLEPKGQHGEIEARILSEDYRNLHIILCRNGFWLCLEVEGVLCYKPMSLLQLNQR